LRHGAIKEVKNQRSGSDIHHRVKNNLQVVSSLLNIQESAVEDEQARHVFIECQSEIQTMAMVHEALYNASSLNVVDMQSYFERLLDYLSSVYEAEQRGIACSVGAAGVSLRLDEAMPVALVVNELVGNSMKHAFPGDRRGRVLVSLRSEAGALDLSVEDDGVGLGPEGPAGAGIGTDLVEALAAQLHGEVSRSPGRGGAGTLVRLSFRERDRG
jgi:two-component sensor histidine kinase